MVTSTSVRFPGCLVSKLSPKAAPALLAKPNSHSKATGRIQDKITFGSWEHKPLRTGVRGITKSHGPKSQALGRSLRYPHSFSLFLAVVLQLPYFNLTNVILGWKVCWCTDIISSDQAEQDVPENKENRSNLSSSLSMSKLLSISNLKTDVMSAYYTIPRAPSWESAPRFFLN